jgi:hypothetical protein
VESGAETEEEQEKPSTGNYEETIKALSAQLQEQEDNQETKLQRQEKGLHPGQGSLPGMFRCGLR